MEKSLKKIIEIDYYRNYGTKFKIRKIFFNKKVRFLVIFRILQKLFQNQNDNNNILRKVLRKGLNFYYRRLEFSFKVEISPGTYIEEGLYLPHLQNIIINSNTKIGKNCTILQDVTIGNNPYKGLEKLAIIGDNVTICAGVKIIGDIKIGNNLIIGANSVVVKSFNDNLIIAGNPAKVIREEKDIYIHNLYTEEKSDE